MSEWASGYAACIGDMRLLMRSRGASFPARYHALFERLADDLIGDASVIGHEQLNRDQRAELREQALARPVRQESLL